MADVLIIVQTLSASFTVCNMVRALRSKINHTNAEVPWTYILSNDTALCNCDGFFYEETCVSIVRLKSSLAQHDVHFINYGPFKNRIAIKVGYALGCHFTVWQVTTKVCSWMLKLHLNVQTYQFLQSRVFCCQFVRSLQVWRAIQTRSFSNPQGPSSRLSADFQRVHLGCRLHQASLI